MKNIPGTIIGFVSGMAGFLWLFKIIVLNNVPPSDELAPGIVVIASICSGLLFAYVSRTVQSRMRKKSS